MTCLRKTIAHCDFKDHGCFNLSIKCAKIITQANIGPVLYMVMIGIIDEQQKFAKNHQCSKYRHKINLRRVC